MCICVYVYIHTTYTNVKKYMVGGQGESHVVVLLFCIIYVCYSVSYF